jgi:hypothetical protein
MRRCSSAICSMILKPRGTGIFTHARS